MLEAAGQVVEPAPAHRVGDAAAAGKVTPFAALAATTEPDEALLATAATAAAAVRSAAAPAAEREGREDEREGREGRERAAADAARAEAADEAPPVAASAAAAPSPPRVASAWRARVRSPASPGRADGAEGAGSPCSLRSPERAACLSDARTGRAAVGRASPEQRAWGALSISALSLSTEQSDGPAGSPAPPLSPLSLPRCPPEAAPRSAPASPCLYPVQPPCPPHCPSPTELGSPRSEPLPAAHALPAPDGYAAEQSAGDARQAVGAAASLGHLGSDPAAEGFVAVTVAKEGSAVGPPAVDLVPAGLAAAAGSAAGGGRTPPAALMLCHSALKFGDKSGIKARRALARLAAELPGGREALAAAGEVVEADGGRAEPTQPTHGSLQPAAPTHLVSHLVLGQLRRSEKVLVALAAGAWLLTPSWLDACHAACAGGEWVAEGAHAIEDTVHGDSERVLRRADGGGDLWLGAPAHHRRLRACSGSGCFHRVRALVRMGTRPEPAALVRILAAASADAALAPSSAQPGGPLAEGGRAGASASERRLTLLVVPDDDAAAADPAVAAAALAAEGWVGADGMAAVVAASAVVQLLCMPHRLSQLRALVEASRQSPATPSPGS
ncbi:hypothetical protein T492DRAFT_847110 [Pavlovales sp. CCMP2436]|nr:hypothetical protein T492DRAFT_847110 [Pavlovales sp. CCMP2436]